MEEERKWRRENEGKKKMEEKRKCRKNGGRNKMKEEMNER